MSKSHYCPKCLESRFYLRETGVIELIMNQKQMDSGRFLFNLAKDTAPILERRMHEKIDEFFCWYKTFNNRTPIVEIDICSADFKCESCGHIPTIKQRQSVIDIVISKKAMLKSLAELAQSHSIEVKLKSSF